MEHGIQMQQLLPLALQQFRYGDARPPGHHLGDLVFTHMVTQEAVLLLGGFALLFLQFLLELGELPVFQRRGLVEVVFVLRLLDTLEDVLDLFPQLLDLVDALLLVLPISLHPVEAVAESGQLLADLHQVLEGSLVGLLAESRLLDLQLHDLPGDLVHLGGHGVHLGLDHGAGLIHEVDRLVRQETVGDISIGKNGRGDQCLVPDLYAVEDLVAGLQAPQDGDGILHAGLGDHDRLEPALQGSVLLNVFTVLV